MYKIFDVHTHTYPEKIAAKAVKNLGEFYDFVPEGDGTYGGLSADAAKKGVRGFLLFSVATNAHQVTSVNDCIAALAKKSREAGFETVGFAGMYQDFPDFEGEIDRCRKMGLRGVKLHPDFQKFYIDDPAVYPLYEIIQETQLPILMHMGDPHQTYSQPQRLAKVLKEFPKLRVIAAHLGGWERWEEAVVNLKADERLRFDTSSCSPFLPKDKMREIIQHYGAENCFFGVDFPMWDHEEELERFFALSLTDYENRRILSENLIEWIHQTNKK